MKKTHKLKINGYKNIISGKMIEKLPIKLTDTTIYLYTYDVNGKNYYVFGSDIQVIGYTDSEEIVKFYTFKSQACNYNLFWKLCGRN